MGRSVRRRHDDRNSSPNASPQRELYDICMREMYRWLGALFISCILYYDYTKEASKGRNHQSDLTCYIRPTPIPCLHRLDNQSNLPHNNANPDIGPLNSLCQTRSNTDTCTFNIPIPSHQSKRESLTDQKSEKARTLWFPRATSFCTPVCCGPYV